MASCTQVETLFQAYIDGELEGAQRLILEQHVAECSACAHKLRLQQKMCAELFEVFSAERLDRDLTQSVIEHLPEMEGGAQDIAGVNWRAKHPASRLGRLGRWVPAAALVILVVTAAIIKMYWPDRVAPPYSVGVMLYSDGDVTAVADGTYRRERVTVASYVEPGRRYETGEDGRFMAGLTGETTIKANNNTRLRIEDERGLRIEKGEVWLDVGHDGRLFRVDVPGGVVTVFGTALNLRVNANETTVTVEEGEVQVENSRGFRLIGAGEELRVAQGREPSEPRRVNAAATASWARGIEADDMALGLLASLSASHGYTAQLSAKDVFLVDMSSSGGRLEIVGLRLSWDPAMGSANYASYHIYGYDEHMKPVFKGFVDGRVFNDEERYYDLSIDEGPLRGLNVLTVRAAPDPAGGEPVNGLQVAALVR